MSGAGHGHGDGVFAHEHGELRYSSPGAAAEVFAARAEVVFDPPAPPAEVRARTETFLRDLGVALTSAGCVLIGHVKGSLDADPHGSLTFSLTSLDGDARVVATLSGEIGTASLTINVIVFGVAEAALSALVTQSWRSGVHAATTWHG